MHPSSNHDSSYLRPTLFWLGVFVVFFALLYVLSDMLLPFILGLIIAYFLDPVADKLEEWKFSRGVATLIIISLFFLILLICLFALSPILLKQLAGLTNDLPSYIEILRREVYELFARFSIKTPAPESLDISTLSSTYFADGQKVLGSVLASGIAVINTLSLILITPVVAFYLLRDWDKLVARVDGLLPRHYATTIREQASLVNDTLAGFLRGQINVMIILGSYYAFALFFAGLKYGIVIGLVSGLLIIIPYLGAFIGGALAIGVAYVQYETLTPIGVIAAIYVTGQMVEGYFLTPNLVGDRVGLHPVWIIFGMLAGGHLFGFVGILVAVPVTAIIGVLIRFMIARYEESDFYEGDDSETS